MTMAQSNSMGAKSDLLFQLCWCHSLWMCALCPLPLLLSRHVLSFLSLDPFFLLSLSPFSGFIFFLTRLCFSALFYIFSLFFHELSIFVFPAFWGFLICLSVSFHLHPFTIIISLSIYFFFSPTTAFSVYHRVPPSMCVPLCICMIFFFF